MGLFSRKVEVTLIDDRSGAVMAVTRLKPDALPASFFTSTTMHLGDANWSVVSAAPMTRAEYTKAGKLVLRLRPVELIDPKELLFSLPTICDQLPASDGAEADGTEVALRDDDWRQFELVSETLLPILETEINAVWAIHQSARVGVGFQKVHVRSGLPQPIDDKTVPFADVQRLAGERLCLPLRFDGAGRRVTDGFAFHLDEQHVLYGVRSGATVEILGFYPCPPPGMAGLEDLAARCGLLAVDWCRCVAARPGEASFTSLLVEDL